MKKATYYILLMLPFLCTSFSAFSAIDVRNSKMPPPSSNTFIDALDMTSFLELTPKQFRQQTGRRMKIKEVIALKVAQKKIRKSLRSSGQEKPAKSQIVALILALLVGVLGIHRFYLGHHLIGVLQLITLGCCGIWTIIDIVNILTDNLRPADGRSYDPEL